nr:protein anti-silencing 1-like [Tanacetum cinerariifolium]
MVENKSKHEEKLHADVNNLKDLGTFGVTGEKLNQKNGKISSKVVDDSEGKIIQNSKDGGSAKLPDNKKLGNNGSGSAKLLGNKKLGNSGSREDLVPNPSLAKGKSKSELALDSTAINKGSKQEQSSEGKIIKKSNNDGSKKLPDNKKLGNSGSGKDLAPASSTDRDKKSAYQEFVCGQKPNDVNDDKSKWFRQLPWDERLKNEYDQGKAILLHNVDPDYISSEIKDIVWHTFNKKCIAKIVQCTALSSLHYGQAIILLNKKEAT